MDRETSNGRLRRTIARVLAVVALAGVVVALVVVIGDSTGSSDGGGGDRQARRAEQRQQTQDSAATYVVQPNDTLGGIAAKTGVSVEDLQNLNPDVDPQALPSGATLKLR